MTSLYTPFRSLVTLALALGLLASPAPASEVGRPLSSVFLPEDYHGFEQVWNFAQTPDGLLYATNYGALREFDGHEWRTISLPTSFVFRVAAGADGRLYIAGFDEIGYVEKAVDGGRHYVSLVPKLPAGEAALGQAQTCLAFNGAIWWCTVNRVLRWDGKELKVWRFEAPMRLRLLASESQLFLDEGAVALHRFDADTDSFRVLSEDKALATLAAGIFDNLAGWKHLVVRSNGSLVGFDDQGRLEKLASGSELPELAHRVTQAIRLHDGRLALATKGYGLLLVDPVTLKVSLQFGTSGGLASPEIFGVFEDREKGLWLGTSLGLARVDPSLDVTVFDRDNGGPAGISYSLFRYKGRVYSRGDDGLYLLTPAEGVLGHTTFTRVEAEKFKSNDFATSGDQLLIASDLGLLSFDGERVRQEFESSHALSYVFCSPKEPDTLLYSDSMSLHVAKKRDGRWQDAGAVPGTDMDVRSIAEDRDGSLWIGSPVRGVFRLSRPAGESDWTKATLTSYSVAKGLPEGHEWTTARQTPHGVMLVHSKGVSVYDASTDRLVPAGAFDAVGKNGRYIYAFSPAGDGTLWVQIGDPTRGEKPELGGVVPVSGGGWRWVPLPAKVGDAVGYLGAQELAWEPGETDKGVLWVAGQKNLLRVELAQTLKLAANRESPTLLREITLGSGQHLPLPGPLEPLSHTREELRFHFVSPLFEKAGPPEFQYRLRGFQETWSPWDARSESVYTNLPGGDYVFEVRSRRPGAEPGPVATWSFSVEPPWWLTSWAVAGYVFGGIVAFGLLLRWRLSAERREREKLEQLVRQRTDEVEQARQRAEEASRAKTMFLAGMSHELRTPLHAILGYSRLLADDASVPARARERLEIVKASGQHLLRLINEVLDLSKIEAGKLELRAESVDLRLTLQEVCDAQEARASLKGLRFVRPGVDMPNHVLADAPKLRQVLENLLGNATKFTRDGEVRLDVSPVADKPAFWRFTVTDTGPGISAEDCRRLFQPFTQATQVPDVSEKGTGLGLAISLRLVALMGGRLWVESEPGKGSSFHFEIPLPPATASESSRVEGLRPVGYAGPRRFVLAVDDVEVNRRLFADLLAPLGFEMSCAASAEEALELLQQRRPDLLLLDLRLPGMSGIELARRARLLPQLDGMKILAASASVLGHNPAEALAAGCDGFIPKPFLENDFLAKVGELLGIQWITTEAPVVGTGRLDPAALRDLRRAALDGDVVAMRAAFERLRTLGGDGARLARIEGALQRYDTEDLVKLAGEGLGES